MHGARSPAKTDWTPAKGRSVTIWPDHDHPGADFARLVAELADEAGGTTVSIVAVPAELPEGWDLADQPPADWTIERLRGLLEAAPAWKPEAEPCAHPRHAQRPMVRVMSGDIAEATEASLRVLAGETDPFAAVYGRSNLLVRPIRIRDRLDAGGIRRPMEALILHVVDADWLCLRLAQLADFYVVWRGGLKSVDPPGRLCRVVLAAAPWPGLPTLTGIIEAPTILPTGSVIQTPGYDATTGLLFDPGDTRFPPIRARPSRSKRKQPCARSQSRSRTSRSSTMRPGRLRSRRSSRHWCGAACGLLRWRRSRRSLKVENRDTAYRLQRDSLPVAATMELRGVGIDLDAHAKLCATLAGEP